METPFAEFLTDLEKNGYQYPPIGARHEIESFNFQSSGFNDSLPLLGNARQRVLDRMEAYYSHSKWTVREDFLTDKHIEDTIEIIIAKNPKKNPGSVYSRAGMNSNEKVLSACGLEGIVSSVRARLNALLLPGADTRWTADPVRIFQKPEGHKLSKVVQRRWRLIWGVSLIDQIVDRLLYTEVVDASLEAAEKQSAKPGLSFKHGGVDRTVRYYAAKCDVWNSLDASSFDFTVSGDQLDLVRELNSRLCTTLSTDPRRIQWEQLSVAREQAVKYGSLVFSDGTVLKQILPGIQKSGRYTTIDGNCKVVVSNRVRYDISKDLPSNPDLTLAMGDDAVEGGLADPKEYVAFVKQECGNTLTIECPTGTFKDQSFCSMGFKESVYGYYVGVPSNWKKTSWALARMDKSKYASYAETLLNLCIEYVFEDHFQLLYAELLKVSPSKARSRRWFENVHLSMESAHY